MSIKSKLEILREIQKELEERKSLKLFFSDDYITIEYHKVNHWLYVDWKGYQTERSVKEGCENILSGIIQYGCNKVLNDNTNVVGIWTPAAQWVGSNWLPRMVNAGLQYFAWVYSPAMLSKISTDEALKHTPTLSVVKTFQDIKSATQWLQCVDKLER